MAGQKQSFKKRFKRSRLGQNYNRWRGKNNLLRKGSSEAGWAKITTDGEEKTTFFKKVQAKQVGPKLQPMAGKKQPFKKKVQAKQVGSKQTRRTLMLLFFYIMYFIIEKLG
jgi:hypothetical protein